MTLTSPTRSSARAAARLLGTEVVPHGIRAGVARSLVRLGVGLEGINTRKTLREGIDAPSNTCAAGKRLTHAL